jgi:hypothetical protein
MKSVPVFVGLDYHQDSVQVCVERGDGLVLANRRCRNDEREVVHDRPVRPGVLFTASQRTAILPSLLDATVTTSAPPAKSSMPITSAAAPATRR